MQTDWPHESVQKDDAQLFDVVVTAQRWDQYSTCSIFIMLDLDTEFISAQHHMKQISSNGENTRLTALVLQMTKSADFLCKES